MLSKEAKKEWNIHFWNGLKNEMKCIPSFNGRRINWLTYPTDIKHVFLRLVCDNDFVSLQFDIQLKDEGIRAIFWEQMEELRLLINSKMNYPSAWVQGIKTPEGLLIDQISWRLENTNYLLEENWQSIYDFFKSRLIAFDEFYQEFKEILINLLK